MPVKLDPEGSLVVASGRRASGPGLAASASLVTPHSNKPARPEKPWGHSDGL